jgi:hypothetical protein
LKGSTGGSEHIEGLMNKAGVGTQNPRPDDAASRMLHTGGKIAGGSVVPGAGAKSVMASVAGGAIASEVLGPEWEAVGVAAAPATKQAAAALKNQVAKTVAPNVETFKKAGATPSVGQAMDSPFLQGLENLASTFPGGAGVMRRFVERQQKGLSETAKTDVSAETAGRSIQSGIDRFVTDFKGKSAELYDKLDQHIAKDAPVDVSNTRAALEKLNAAAPGAPALSQQFKNAKLQGIEEALKTDAAQGGALPYAAVKELRSMVGREISEPTLVSDVQRSKWQALYGALSKDMEAVAATQGPEAVEAFSRANKYYKSGIKRIDEVLDPLRSKVDPEDVFKAFTPNSPDQVNKVRAVMRSLNPSERKVVSDAVVNRLGRATPGKQDELGEVFSSETFLTNYNKLSPGARAQLFPEGMREDMEALAKSAASIRQGAKVFQNPSGTAGKAATYGLAGAVGASVATGNVAPLVGAGAMVAGANISARMLTSAKVVNWLAEASTSKPEKMPALLARLSTIFNDTKDEALKADLGQYVQSVTPKKPQ